MNEHGENSPLRQHETSDVPLRPVALAILFFGLASVTILFGMVMLFDYFSGDLTAIVPPPAFANTRVLPPEPRLQIAPTVELDQLHAREETILNTYGWVNREMGVVRIPIDRAMELVAERGRAK